MEHATITQIGEYFKITPDKGYLIRNRRSRRVYSEVVTKKVSDYEAVAI